MNLLRSLLFLAVLSSIVSRKIATAQDDFGAVLLEAFTTGMFDGESTSEELEPSPAVAPTAFLDDGLLGFPLESVDPEASPMESPEETVDYFFDLDESLLASPEESPVESVEGIDNGFSPFEGETTAMPRPIQVNCGSFDSRNTFSTDVAEWFSLDSIAAVDPFADAQFESNEHALLYSTFRYSPTNLTYTVPVPTNGFWSVTLHWAEITPKYMSIGARIFSVCNEIFHVLQGSLSTTLSFS